MSNALNRCVTLLKYIILTQKMEMECLYLYYNILKMLKRNIQLKIFFFSYYIFLKTEKLCAFPTRAICWSVFPHVVPQEKTEILL